MGEYVSEALVLQPANQADDLTLVFSFASIDQVYSYLERAAFWPWQIPGMTRTIATKKPSGAAKPRPRSGQEVDQKRKRPKALRQVYVDLYVESEGEILAHLDRLSGSWRDEAS